MLTVIAKVLKALNSEASPKQIGWGVAFGVMAGLMPFGLLTLIIIFIACIFTINLSTFLLSWGLSSAFSLVIGALIESLTWQYARHPGLLNLLSGSEALQVLHLHHTQVLGGFVLGLLLLLPVFWLVAKFVVVYRERVMSWVQKLRIVQVIKASKLAQIYNALS